MLKGAFCNERNAPDEIRIVDVVHDWSAFYAPVIDPKLKGISSAKCYKFKGDANGDARMFYKDAMISKEDKPRPYQPGDRFVPRSEAEAQSTFGVLWDASSAEVRPMMISSTPTPRAPAPRRAAPRRALLHLRR